MSNAQLDLSRLALDRSSPNETAARPTPVRRKWFSRFVFPGVILLGFAALMIAAAGNSIWPRPSVEIVPVIVRRSSIQSAGTPLFQAAGWIEPRPMAIKVPALAPGVVEELLVVEGQTVNRGEPIARLISIDAEIAVKQAAAALANAEGEVQRSIAEQNAAQVRFDSPVHLMVQLADAKSFLAKLDTELANLPFLIETAQANLEFARQSLQGKREAGGAVPGLVLQRAESELTTADAKLRELQQRRPGLQREAEALQAKVAALESQLSLLIEETRQLAEAKAKVQSAVAKRDAAKLDLQKAELDLERNTIRTPINGRILRLLAAPGTRVMGQATQAGHDSSSVVEMYDPSQLQVRADVRLEDVPLVKPGQSVEVETASSSKTIQGRVLQPNSTANIQKNTLEVKVELLDPPATIRPEMLVTATFLALESSATESVTSLESERLFIPRQLISTEGNANVVWIVDAENRSRKMQVTVGRSTDGELVEIESGLQVTDKIIASDTNDLNDGSLVEVTGEENSIGR